MDGLRLAFSRMAKTRLAIFVASAYLLCSPQSVSARTASRPKPKIIHFAQFAVLFDQRREVQRRFAAAGVAIHRRLPHTLGNVRRG
jgi:hypothetical protein